MSSPVGSVLLDEVRSTIGKYCILPSEHAEVAVTLWAATTHALQAFEYAPRLVVRSAEKRSGKSRVIEVIDPLVFKPLRSINATTPYIFRSLDDELPPTILFDEADTIFGSKKMAENNEDLRGLINAGFQRGMPVGRTVGPNHTPTEFATFAMVALAGIGKMPDTIEDRAAVVVMRRRKPSETVQPYRTRRDKPALVHLGHRLTEWAASILGELEGFEPENMGIEDRAADTWEPLIAMADMAGGHWPKIARAAAMAMTHDAEEDDGAGSLNISLLHDIREVFTEKFLPSADLCHRLRQIEESPWDDFDINPRKLGHRLREYGVKTGFEDRTKSKRGYLRVDFMDAFARYLPAEPSATAVTVRKASDQQECADASKSADGSHASAPIEPPSHLPSSEAMRTDADACGRIGGPESAETGNREAGVWRVSGASVS